MELLLPELLALVLPVYNLNFLEVRHLHWEQLCTPGVYDTRITENRVTLSR